MSAKDHPFATFSKALEQAGLAKGADKIKLGERVVNGANVEAKNSVQAVPQAQQGLRLPSILIEESARIVFAHWEAIAAKAQKVAPVSWDELDESYRQEWRMIIGTVLEMGVGVILKDAVQFLDQSNGDMGGAFAKALRRYMRERLSS